MFGGSVNTTLRQDIPVAISPSRSSWPSANRKRPRSISCVSLSICAAFGGRVHAHHIGSATRWLLGWAEAGNGQCGRKPFASTLGSHSLVGSLHGVEERFPLTSTIRWRSGLEGHHSRGTRPRMCMRRSANWRCEWVLPRRPAGLHLGRRGSVVAICLWTLPDSESYTRESYR